MESSPGFKVGEPLDDFVAFLARIKNMDPNDSNFSEDNLDASWGHYQFTAGCLNCTTVLTSWDIVGGCSYACDLIAAAFKTCKVAQHLCFEHKIDVMSYLSDIYLENVVSKLWDLWKSVGGVCGYFLSHQIYIDQFFSLFTKRSREPLATQTMKHLIPVNSLIRQYNL